MRNRTTRRRTARWAGTLVVLGAIALAAASFAPATENLTMHGIGHEATADAGGRQEAAILLSVYNAAGPVRGILGGSFLVTPAAAPAGADELKKTAVTEIAPGLYRIGIAPSAASGRWSQGAYVLGVTLTSPSGSGVTVVELRIDP